MAADPGLCSKAASSTSALSNLFAASSMNCEVHLWPDFVLMRAVAASGTTCATRLGNSMLPLTSEQFHDAPLRFCGPNAMSANAAVCAGTTNAATATALGFDGGNPSDANKLAADGALCPAWYSGLAVSISLSIVPAVASKFASLTCINH